MKHRNVRRMVVIGAVLALALVAGAFSVALADCTPSNTGGGGDDNIDCSGSVTSHVDGGAGNDTITNTGTPTGGSFDIDGESGNDTIINNGNWDFGSSCCNQLEGGSGNDTIINNGSVGDDMEGESGNDTLINNGTVDDDLTGGTGDDTITNSGHVGEDIEGGSGDDTVTLLPGSQVDDTVDGGDDVDTLIFNIEITIGEDEGDRYIQQLLAQGASGTFAGHTWTNFENLLERLSFRVNSGPNVMDCGKDPYLGQRPFHELCYPYTGDPMELGDSADMSLIEP